MSDTMFVPLQLRMNQCFCTSSVVGVRTVLHTLPPSLLPNWHGLRGLLLALGRAVCVQRGTRIATCAGTGGRAEEGVGTLLLAGATLKQPSLLEHPKSLERTS